MEHPHFYFNSSHFPIYYETSLDKNEEKNTSITLTFVSNTHIFTSFVDYSPNNLALGRAK